jgi:hypothetical protein
MDTTDSANADRLINDVEAAAILSLSPSYLRSLRVSGGGASYVKIGRAVRYRLPVLLAWANSNTVAATPQNLA